MGCAMYYFWAVLLDFDKSIQSHTEECVDKVQVFADGKGNLLLYWVQFVFTCGVLSIWYVCFIYSYINIILKKASWQFSHQYCVFNRKWLISQQRLLAKLYHLDLKIFGFNEALGDEDLELWFCFFSRKIMKNLMHLLTNRLLLKNILSESISQLAQTLCMHYVCVIFCLLRPLKRSSLCIVRKTRFAKAGVCCCGFVFFVV